MCSYTCVDVTMYVCYRDSINTHTHTHVHRYSYIINNYLIGQSALTGSNDDWCRQLVYV